MTKDPNLQPCVHRFGRFTLDLGQGSLLNAEGTEISLRPKSFALLRLLVENAGRLMDRDVLMTALWPNVVVTDESLAQCVSDVRRALGADGQAFIRTIPKRGYRFASEVKTENIQLAPREVDGRGPTRQDEVERGAWVREATSAGVVDGLTPSSDSGDASDSFGEVVAFIEDAEEIWALGDHAEDGFGAGESALRQLVETLAIRHEGHLIAPLGRGFMMGFPGARNAVRWVSAIQSAAASAPSGAPLKAARISLHRIVGNIDHGMSSGAVDIVTTLVSYVDPGGVIASAAFRACAGIATELPSIDLGEIRLANTDVTVRAFQLRVGGASRPALPAEELLDPRPSIVVLPFRKDLADADQAYFVDGITEGIIRVLAGFNDLFVISHNSTLTYTDATPDTNIVGRELNVRYVLCGSVRRLQNRLRIGIELNDEHSHTIILARVYDGGTEDLFELQDRISFDVTMTIAPQIHQRELQRAFRKHPANLSAYDFVLRGLDLIHRLSRQSFSQGRGMLQRAMSDDPTYAPAFSYAAWWHILMIAQGWSLNPAGDAMQAASLALAATERDPNDAMALAIQGYVTAYSTSDFATAEWLVNRAVEASPNCALAWTFSSIVYSWLGDGPRAVLNGERGVRLSPLDPFAFLQENFLSMAYYINGDFDKAISLARSAAVRNPRHAPTLRGLAVSLVASGRDQEAREVAPRLLDIEPRFRLATFADRTPLRGAMRDLYIERLRQAGLPD